MRIIKTAEHDFSAPQSDDVSLWIYNGMDCCITNEVVEAQLPLLNKNTAKIYNWELAQNAQCLAMSVEGVLVDINERNKLVAENKKYIDNLQAQLDTLANAVWGKGLNFNSPKQLSSFLYEELKLPKQYKFDKGKRKVTTNREAIENLGSYLYAKPFCALILLLRDVGKLNSSLLTSIDPDNRLRAGFGPARTKTGRYASSSNPYGTGTNLQNQTERVRRIYIADESRKLGYPDLEQAESRLVGLLLHILFDDPRYLDTCESEDLHTLVCRLVWDELAWTGDLKLDKKKVAGQVFYRTMTYRDMAKRGGHGTNYAGKPPHMAKQLHVATPVMENFQHRYFKAFPSIPEWHNYVRTEIAEKAQLVTPVGRERNFFGETGSGPRGEATLREAIAQVPQSTVGDILNRGLYNVHKRRAEFDVRVSAQIHDAILFSYPEKYEEQALSSVLADLLVPFTVAGREFAIPVEMMCGWNWGYASKENPDGMVVWEKDKPDNRVRTTRKINEILDRQIYS